MSNCKCSKCGSTDVERLMWVNAVTGIANGYYIDEDDADDPKYNYCNNCDNNTTVEWLDEDNLEPEQVTPSFLSLSLKDVTISKVTGNLNLE